MKKRSTNPIVIYQAKSGAIELRGDFEKETIWATQAQVAGLFDIERSVATKHIRNILKDKELDSNSVCAKFAHTSTDGKSYQVKFYNLDLILAVGYRASSASAIEFRQWATKILREHITKGYTINRKKIAKNYSAFMRAVSEIQILLPERVTLDPKMALELIKEFASTWISLDAYDKESLKVVGTTKKAVSLTGEELMRAIQTFRAEVVKNDDAKDLFAHEREHGNIVGIVGNVMQSFGGKRLYQSIEEKAAHLLYFMVKNHPFTDGNKRCGAFAFIWFLRKYYAKGSRNINPASLTALTLLIAESDPKKKNLMIGLVTRLLS